MSSQESSKELPDRSKDSSGTATAAETPPADNASADKGPSKSALKKLAKEREKAEKAAKRAAQEQEERAKAQANDTAKHLYGPLSLATPRPAKTFCSRLTDLESVEVNSEVTVQARVYNARVQSAKLAFLVLREQEHTIQVVIAEGGEHGISRQMVKFCGGINTESYVRVTGLLQQPREPVHSTSLSKIELHVESLYVVSAAEEQLPLQVKDCSKPPPAKDEGDDAPSTTTGTSTDEPSEPNASLKTRLDNKVLSARAAASNAIFQLQSEICAIYTEYMLQHGFTMIQPSYLAGAATEGGSGVFEVSYFERKAYLTQSPQFFKQMAIAADLGPVFSIGPVFRAENSNTKRHLTEFTGLDFEMPIREHYHEVIAFGEQLMLHLIRELQTRPKPARLTSIIRDAGYTDAGNFLLPAAGQQTLRLDFSAAKQILTDADYPGSSDPAFATDDFDTPQEKALGELIHKQYKTDFYSIDQYPLSVRPFYTHPSATQEGQSNSYDFFMRGQEIMSGAQRIHELDLLRKSMKEKGVNPDDPGFKDYLDAFRYGCPMHGGGGLGLNRILMLYLGLNNVREATLFVRDPVRLGP